jgi:hypothetical protein
MLSWQVKVALTFPTYSVDYFLINPTADDCVLNLHDVENLRTQHTLAALVWKSMT